MPKHAGLHKRIREARLAAGLTQPALARACGVTRAAVSQWESPPGTAGHSRPTYEKLQAIAKATGQDLSTLLGEVTGGKFSDEQRMIARLWIQIPKGVRSDVLPLLRKLAKK